MKENHKVTSQLCKEIYVRPLQVKTSIFNTRKILPVSAGSTPKVPRSKLH